MKLIWSIAKRELKSYFFSPVAFIFIVIFLISQLGFTFILGKFYSSNNASLEIFFTFQPWLYLFLVPAIGMRLWAEEKREGTIEYLMTLPILLHQLVIGKFLASWFFLFLALFLTSPIILTLYYLGSPDFGPIFSGYFFSWLMAGAFLSIASFTSSLTKNQVISFVLSVIVCFVLVLVGFGIFQEYMTFLPVSAQDFISNLGFIPHFQSSIRGVITLRDFIYFISMICFFLVLNTYVLDKNNSDVFSKNSSKRILTTTSVLILFLALISINFIVSKINLKLDLTQNKLYSLSQGSKKIVQNIDDEVIVKYFFSRSNEAAPVMLKNYGARIDELLREFAYHSPNLSIVTYDPKPDSDEEEMASKYGVSGVQLGQGDSFFMGAAVLYQDKIHNIPFFDPRKETFLEYEIASLLAKLKGTAEKPVLGILAGFELQNPGMPPHMAMQHKQENEWLFVGELEKIFEIRHLEKSLQEVPDGVDLLLVLHPIDFSDKTEYAIEQFILSGKRAVIAVDPSAKSVPQQGSPYASYGMQGSTNSDLKNIFQMLELEYDKSKVIVDRENATRVNTQGGPVRYPYWLSLNEKGFNKDMILTNQLNSALFVEAGYFRLKDESNNKFTSLIYSSPVSGTIETEKLMFISPQNFDQFNKLNKPLTISGIVKGNFKAVFKEKPKESNYSKEHISESKEENSVLFIADVDFLNNSYSLRELSFFGQTIVQPINQNIVYLSNVLEFISGSPELISIRSRGTFTRPFSRVEEIEQKAQAKWFNVEKELTDKIAQVQGKLNALQSARTDDNRLMLTEEQKNEIQKFRHEEQQFKRNRREVRKNLRQDVEKLGTTLTVLNMTIVPLLVLIFGLYIYIRRSQGKHIFKEGVM